MAAVNISSLLYNCDKFVFVTLKYKSTICGIVALASLSLAPTAKAVTITNNSNALNLVNTLLGNNSGITIVGTPTYTGSSLAAGTFTGGNAGSKIGVDDGVVLSTGKVSTLPGGYSSSNTGTDFNTAGDPNLTPLAPGSFTKDAAVLTFSFTSSTNNLYLNKYVFTSQEYSEYVGTQYNDVFGYFLDNVNIAVIPGTSQPVSVNTINNGQFNSGIQAVNPNLYIDNSNNTLGVNVGGITKPLTAKSLNIGTGVHTFKLAIADAGDGNLDSAIFLQGGSLSAFPDATQSGESLTSVPEPSELLGTLLGGLAAYRVRRNMKATSKSTAKAQ